jgi:hypothetical protein
MAGKVKARFMAATGKYACALAVPRRQKIFLVSF